MDDAVTQAVVVTDQTAHKPHQRVEKIALFDSAGNPFTGLDQTFEPITVAGAIGTAAKTAVDAEPAANTFVVLKFTSGNTAASATVAFDGGAARAVRLGGAAPTGAELTLAADGVAVFWFDGTYLHQLGVYA